VLVLFLISCSLSHVLDLDLVTAGLDLGLTAVGHLDLLATGPGLVPVSGGRVLDLVFLILMSLMLVLTLVSQLLVTLIS